MCVQGDTYVFMDMETYEEVRMPRDDSWAGFLKEGTDCSVVFHNGVVISVEPPLNIVLTVKQTDPGVKGNTATSGALKPATLETGAIVQARSPRRPGRPGTHHSLRRGAAQVFPDGASH